MYVNWGLIVKVSKARHDCGGGTISSIQKFRTMSPIISHTRSMQQSICSPAADLVSCLSLSEQKGKLQTKLKLKKCLCARGLSFHNSTEENPVGGLSPTSVGENSGLCSTGRRPAGPVLSPVYRKAAFVDLCCLFYFVTIYRHI